MSTGELSKENDLSGKDEDTGDAPGRKINTEEAATLLDALEEDNGQKTSSAPGKVLKIKVSDKD